MKPSNRDLLVLVKTEFDSELAMQNTLQQLNNMLFSVETDEKLCIANEVIDLNRYKIFTSVKKIMKVLNQPELKPFQFICNKN
jgi:hypothetical protein